MRYPTNLHLKPYCSKQVLLSPLLHNIRLEIEKYN